MKKLFFSLPVQLTLLNLKKNVFIMFFWFLLFGFLLGDFGLKIGIPYLFFDPEYMGETSFQSLYLIGIFTGLFIGSFSIALYILDGHKFVFLAYSHRPFVNFTLNNALFPSAYSLVYIYKFVVFQEESNKLSDAEIAWESGGFVLGLITVTLTMFVYFSATNKNWYKYLAKNINSKLKTNKYNKSVVMNKILSKNEMKDRVDYYVAFPFRIRKVEDIIPYKREELLKVFDQNHLNAIIFQGFMFLIMLVLIIFDEIKYFQIPAACSILSLFTIATMLLGFIYYWFKKWFILGMVVLVIVANYIYSNGLWQKKYELGSLDYTNSMDYSNEALKEYFATLPVAADSQNTIGILNNWKAKQPKEKPKLVLMAVSGGGLRLAGWTFTVLEKLNEETEGQYFDNVALITGASGGMIGAAYYRELVLRNDIILGDTLGHKKYLDFLWQDALNPIAMKMLIHDPFATFVPFLKTSDRGVAFDKQFNENTNYILEKPLCEYREPEFFAKVPMLFLSPTIVENSKKFYLSAQPISYMVEQNMGSTGLNGIEYSSFFSPFICTDISMITCLRMNSTFPYISPMISLPTEPEIKVMDAGVSDNFGIKDAIRFTKVFSKWINQNTSGVVIVSVRDSGPPLTKKDQKNTLLNELFDPIGVVYNNIFNTQKINNEELINYSKEWIKNVDVVYFTYATKEDSEKMKSSLKASLSWHLTNPEKMDICNAINNQQNIESIEKLKKLLY